MNLQELQVNKKTVVVTRALREHYNLDMDFDKLTLQQSQKMLTKVRGLLKEARSDKKIYESQKNPAYLKLVMMEQALTDRINDLRSQPARIMVENEEVQKSQVILAAQEMVDTLQKMLEQISKMNVEELNAVVEGMKSEFGSEKGDEFNANVGQMLSTLQEAIRSAKQGIESSLGSVTGQTPGMAGMGGMGGMDAEPGMDAGMPGDMEAGADMADAELAAGEEEAEVPEPELEPEEPSDTAAGRGRR
jgi:predicted  nucleic acid-binding Zn-ribbon protein